MDTLHALLRRLGESVAAGDVDSAVALFAAEGRVALHDGERVVSTVSPRAGLAAAAAAFSDIAYAPVLHLAGDGFSDDGVLTATHRGPFLGCPPTGRRVYLNVHLSGQVSADGLLDDLSLGCSLASLRHQLRGGGDAVAVADGLTAEVRHRMWSPRPESEVTLGASAGVDAAGSETTSRRGTAAVLAVVVLLLLVVAGLGVSRLPALRGDDSVASIPPATSASGSAARSPTTTAPSPRVSTTPEAFASAPSSSTAGAVPRIVAPTGPPQVQPGRQVVLPSDVLFGFDSAQLSPQTRTTLTDLAHEITAAHVAGQIQVNGYTDNLGSAAHGLDLSKQRALAVAEALQAALGSSPVTLVVQGFGDADPIADNATEEGRTRNRRVTIVLPATTP